MTAAATGRPVPMLGGEIVGLVAAGIFVLFAVWIVVQRLRNGKGGRRE